MMRFLFFQRQAGVITITVSISRCVIGFERRKILFWHSKQTSRVNEVWVIRIFCVTLLPPHFISRVDGGVFASRSLGRGESQFHMYVNYTHTTHMWEANPRPTVIYLVSRCHNSHACQAAKKEVNFLGNLKLFLNWKNTNKIRYIFDRPKELITFTAVQKYSTIHM